MTFLASKDWLLKVAAGEVSGYSIVHKFGRGTVGTSLVPVTTTLSYSTPTTATALEFLSSDTNDTSAGTGAREVTVIGLDSSWNEVSQTVTTNGTSAVALSTNLIRLYRWYVSSSGTYATATAGSHVGTLTIRESGGGTTWSQIDTSPFSVGQSQIACYTVPTGKTAYLLSAFAETDSTKTSTIVVFQRPSADDVSSPYSGAMRMVKDWVGKFDEVVYTPASAQGPFVGPCDIGVMAKVGTGSATLSADLEFLVVG